MRIFLVTAIIICYEVLIIFMKCHPENTIVTCVKQSLENAEIQKLNVAIKRSREVEG